MNNYIYIGYINNTHGIKGEIRIISDFELKDKVFKKGFSLYIGDNKEKLIINTYRKHKNYDMVTFNRLDNINDVIKYKKQKVYINRTDIEIKDYVYDDLIGLSIYEDELLGQVIDYYNNNGNIILEVKYNKIYYIPLKGNYIKKVDLDKKMIYTDNVRSLII